MSNTNQRWNEHDGSWQNTTKNDFFRGENSEVTITSVENLTGWQYTTKTENVYDAENKQTYSLTFSWDNSIDDWSLTPMQKCEWVYDNNGRMTECLKKRFDNKANEWSVAEARIVFFYDKEGSISEEMYQSWNEDSKSWINGGKYNYSNDNETQKTAISYFYVSDRWVFDGKIIYLYDNEAKLVRADFYGENADDIVKAYSLYNYSEKSCPVISETTADINIFPNPVVSSFELTVPETLVGKTASIFDAYGKFVKSIIINNEKTQVNVNGIFGGIYVLQIGDKTKKFVIK